MFVRKYRVPLIVVAATALVANLAWALGLGLGETKQQLKLEYDVVVKDIGTNGYMVDLTIADQGRLKPLSDVGLYVYGKETIDKKRPVVDLALSLATRKDGDKMAVHFQLNREWAERAEIKLRTYHLDGNETPLTSYFYTIPLADYLKGVKPKQD